MGWLETECNRCLNRSSSFCSTGSAKTESFAQYRVDDTYSPTLYLSAKICFNVCFLQFGRGCVKSFCARVQSDIKEGSNVSFRLENCFTFLGRKNMLCRERVWGIHRGNYQSEI